ncbi:MAG: TetR/AcrR family transcriptional regulator [Hyphomonadaceae bacterium]
MSAPKAAARKPRADSERNRRLLLETAKAAFAQKGAEVSLDEIARAAGVGIGTLYRHFPTREALLQDVYRDETERLFASAEKLAETLPPVEALRKWMRHFLQYFATKQMVLEALTAMVGPDAKLHGASGAQVEGAITLLVRNAEKSGALKFDIAPLDLLRAVIGVSTAGALPGWEKAAYKVIDILIEGARVK